MTEPVATEPRCTACPVPGDMHCARWTWDRPELCAKAGADPSYAGMVRAVSYRDAGRCGELAPRPVPADIPPPSAERPPRLLELVEGCDYRGPEYEGPRPGCGCGDLRVCLRGTSPRAGRPDLANLDDCLVCVSRPT